MMAFANSTWFTPEHKTEYKPFMPLGQVRAMFDEGTKVCMAIGGWGDTEGFSLGTKTDQSRKAYALNVAETVEKLGFDCVGMYS